MTGPRAKRQSCLVAQYGARAVVTGASDGIGKAFAERLAGAGFDLVLVARRTDILEAVAADLRRRYSVDVTISAYDFADPSAAKALLAATERQDVGLLVAAAGFGTSGPFIAIDPALELQMIEVNCRAVTELAHGFARRFAACGRGGIVLMGSLVGWQGAPSAATYAATKAFVQTLAEGLFVELRPLGVDVLSCAPGPVRSGFGSRARMNLGLTNSPKTVARAALRALGRRSTVIPGVLGKVLTWSLAPLPRWLRVAMMGRIMTGISQHDQKIVNAPIGRPA